MPLAALEHRPAYLSVRSYRESYGDLAAEVGKQLGMEPDAEQRAILDAIFAEDVPGAPAFFSVAVIAPRQNLKTSTLEIAALTDLFVFGVPLHVWTAHLFPTAKKTFEHMVGLIAANEDFRSRCRWPPRTANGDESIELLTGERIEFRARSGGGGRGFTGNKVTLDEALYLDSTVMGALLPTMVTQRDGQVRYGSSAGIDRSAVLRGVRDRGRGGKDRRLAYFEWCAPQRGCASPDCSHVLGVAGCVADDVEMLASANPALGRRITIDALLDQRGELPPEEFIREFLGWWDEPVESGGALDLTAWAAQAGEPPSLKRPLAWGVDVDEAGVGTIAVAWRRPDRRVHAQLVSRRPDAPDDLRFTATQLGPRAQELRRKYGGKVWAGGGAASLLDDADIVSGPEFAAACEAVADLLASGGLWHCAQPDLDRSVEGARWRSVGSAGQRAWQLKNATGVGPLAALTRAVHGLTAIPVEPPPPPMAVKTATATSDVDRINF